MNREALHCYVAQRGTQARLAAYVRRRGVLQDPEDIVQQVICDTLAVEAVPVEEDDFPRLVNTIARRRVADWFRRRKHQATTLPELSTQSDPEARILLRRLQHNLESDSERATLGWLLREHAGESLKDIARDLRMDAAVLRQRICRLRRQLRAEYLGMAAAVLLVLVSGWYALAPAESREPATLSATAAYDGRWRVISAPGYQAAGWPLQVVIQGSVAELVAPGGRALRSFSLQVSDAEVAGSQAVLVRSGDQRWRVRLKSLDSQRVELRSGEGRVVLERVGGAR